MKRPLAVLGLAVISASAVCGMIGAEISCCHYVLAAFAFAAMIVCALIKPLKNHKALVPFCAAALTASILYICFGQFLYQPAVLLADKSEHSVTAVFCDLPQMSGRIWNYRMKTESVDGVPVKLYFTLCAPKRYEIEPYDAVQTELSFDKELYQGNIADRFYITAQSNEDFTVISRNSNSPAALILKLRRALLNASSELYGEDEDSFVRAIFLGDKTQLSNDVVNAFRTAGLSHILVLSGLHMTIISAAVAFAVRKLCRNRRFANFLTVVPVVGYMALAGFPPSLVRSGIALISALAADSVFREPDPLNSLGLAALVLCLTNPFSVFDVGMLMSFSATLGIILYQKRLSRFLLSKLSFFSKKNFIYSVAESVINIASLSACATLAIMPFSMLLFGQVSNISILANILLVPLVPTVMVLSAVSVILFCFPMFSILARPIASATSVLIKTVVVWAKLLSKIPFACSVVTKDYIAYCVSAVAVSAIILLNLKNGKRLFKITAALLSVAFLICTVADYSFHSGNAHVKLYSTGQGSLLLTEADGRTCGFYSSKSGYPSRRFSDTVDRSGRISLFCCLDKSSAEGTADDLIASNAAIDNLLLPLDYYTENSSKNVGLFASDCTVSVCEEMSVELFKAGGNALAVIDVCGFSILVLPANVKENDFKEFFGKYKDYGFSAVIADKNSYIPQEIADSETDIILAENTAYTGIGATRPSWEAAIPIKQ